MAFRLVAGLGNPGPQYDETRHNVGFRVLDRLSRESGFAFRQDSRGPVEVARAGEVTFVKPLTFMNASGEAIAEWLHWLKIDPSELIVIVDDVTLQLGQLRIRKEGSHGGHNGLRSIEQRVGTTQYARIRCGVGLLPENRELEKFVLDRFAQVEKPLVEMMIESATAAFHCCQRQSISLAMQSFNVKHKDKSEEQ